MQLLYALLACSDDLMGMEGFGLPLHTWLLLNQPCLVNLHKFPFAKSVLCECMVVYSQQVCVLTKICLYPHCILCLNNAGITWIWIPECAGFVLGYNSLSLSDQHLQ